MAELADYAGGDIDVWWDQSGRHNFAQSLPLLAHGGKTLITAGMGAEVPLPVGNLYIHDLSILGFAISNASVPALRSAALVINDLLASHSLVPRRVRTMPWHDVAAAHRALEEGTVSGKIVLTG